MGTPVGGTSGKGKAETSVPGSVERIQSDAQPRRQNAQRAHTRKTETETERGALLEHWKKRDSARVFPRPVRREAHVVGSARFPPDRTAARLRFASREERRRRRCGDPKRAPPHACARWALRTKCTSRSIWGCKRALKPDAAAEVVAAVSGRAWRAGGGRRRFAYDEVHERARARDEEQEARARSLLLSWRWRRSEEEEERRASSSVDGEAGEEFRFWVRFLDRSSRARPPTPPPPRLLCLRRLSLAVRGCLPRCARRRGFAFGAGRSAAR